MSSEWSFPQSQYRVCMKYRTWIGKPDPSGFSEFVWYCKDKTSLARRLEWAEDRGHKVLKVEERVDES